MTSTNLLDIYFQNLTLQLQARVNMIYAQLLHQGEKGTANENLLKDILEDFLPLQFGVGSGILIDKSGNQSNQTDLIIYDKFRQPSLFRTLAPMIHPIDAALTTIEVKTSLDHQAILDLIERTEKVRSELEIIQGKQGTIDPYANGGMSFGFRGFSYPASILFAYRLTGWKDISTLIRYIQEKTSGVLVKHRFDLIFLLDSGLIIGWQDGVGQGKPFLSPNSFEGDSLHLKFSILGEKKEDENIIESKNKHLGLMMFLKMLYSILQNKPLPNPLLVIESYTPNVPSASGFTKEGF